MRTIVVTACWAAAAIATPAFTPVVDFGGGFMGAAWGDYDNDGDIDLVMTNVDSSITLFRNDGADTFTELHPFGKLPEPTGVAWGDYNNDGRLDLAVGSFGGQTTVFRNDGDDVFTPLRVGEGSETYSVAWADYDGDSFLDLAVANYNDSCRIFRNGGDDRFTGYGRLLYIDHNLGLAWSDYDNDGLEDILCTSDRGADVYVGEPGGGFAWKSRGALGSCFGLAWGDLDNDGFLDYAVSSSSLFRVLKGMNGLGFDDRTPVGTTGASAIGNGDCNNDGALDLVTGDSNLLWLGDGKLHFTRYAPFAQTASHGLAWGDYDDDGDLDIVMTSKDSTTTLYRNELNNQDCVVVDVAGRGRAGYSNRTSIGTKARLSNINDSLVGYREVSVSANSCYSCQNDMRAHFGAPAGDTFTVLVTWPASGIVDTIPNVIPPARLKVVENRRPGLFSLASLAKGAEVSRKPTLVWHKSVDPDGDVVTYDLWYGKDPSFTTSVEVKGLADTTWIPSALLDSATYYWKVLAIDREHRVISYRNHYTDTMAVDSLGAQTWCNEQDWYFGATAAGVSEESGVRSEEIAGPSLTVLHNPARGTIVVYYALPAGERGMLDILDATGRVVESRILSAIGPSTSSGPSAHGPSTGSGPPAHGLRLTANVPPGVYFVRLTAGTQERTAKVVKLD